MQNGHGGAPGPPEMRANLFNALRLLLLDLVSTLFFLVVYLLTHNIPFAIAVSILLGFAQIGWQIAHKNPIDTMQWMSLFLVVASGTAAMLTNDPRFVMAKPSLIYLVVGAVMLKPAWINRYLPPIAQEIVPDIAIIFGFVWSGLMFFSAALNLVLALNFSVATWASLMPVYGIVSKLGLLLIQAAVMRSIGLRRFRGRASLAGGGNAASAAPRISISTPPAAQPPEADWRKAH